MRACNNNNMRNPKLKDVGGGYACYYYCMLSSPVLLHIYSLGSRPSPRTFHYALIKH